MEAKFQDLTWLGWVSEIPEDIIEKRPVLNVDYAWALLTIGDLEGGEKRLHAAGQIIRLSKDTGSENDNLPPDVFIADREQFIYLTSSIAMGLAYIAQARGDISATIKHAQQALDILPEENFLRQGVVSSLLSLALWASGDLGKAFEILERATVNMRKGGNLLFSTSAYYGLAEIKLAQGRLNDAIQIYEDGLSLVTEHGGILSMVAASLHLGLGEVHREKGNFDAAIHHLLKSKEYGDKGSLPDWPHRWHLTQSKISKTTGDLDKALEQLKSAEQLYYRNPMPIIRPLSAMRTRIWIRQNKLSEALGWVQDKKLIAEGVLSYMREYEYITLGRFLIAQSGETKEEKSLEQALELLDRLYQDAKTGNRIVSTIEILILQAIAHEIHKDTSKALSCLEQALRLAEPEGYILIFADEDPVIEDLLEHVLKTKSSVPQAYIQKILGVFKSLQQSDDIKSGLLSEREHEVLQLIAAGLSNKKIMASLFLSESTVKTHIRNIYYKLEVHSRTEALLKAKKLDLL
jgi:LuxR family maltose regulon positive regulatory protein